jgi:hypothetical protein
VDKQEIHDVGVDDPIEEMFTELSNLKLNTTLIDANANLDLFVLEETRDVVDYSYGHKNSDNVS